MSESDSEIEQDQEDLQEGTEEDHLSDLLPRIRILTIFAYWWEELENVVYSDTTRTIRCLHVLSRIIEDSTFASSSDSSEISSALTTTNANNTSNHSLTTSLKEEFHTICERLVKVVIEDFADVAYSVFQLASTSSDANLLKALTRFLVAFKNACVKTSEDFYAIFQTISLEGFITNFLQFNDLITSARVAYIAGELIEDTNSDAPVEINAFIGSSIRHFQQSFERSTALVDQIPRLLARLFERTRYLFDNSIVLPLPQHVHRNQDAPEEEEQRNNNEWFIDDCDDVNSLDFHLSVAIGYLRLLGSVADYTETLTPVIEADFVTLCLKVLEFPLFDLQSVALSWFGSAMAHKRIATEFIEKSGIQRLIYFMNQPEHLEYHDTKAQHVSFITVALAKHSQVMDQFIQDETVASSLVAFGLQMLQEKSMDTQLNIIEWFGDCFGHPFMLTAVNQTNVLAVILAKIEYSFQEDEKLQKTEQMVLLNHSLRREAIRSVLKYLVFNLFYAVQYTKKVDQHQSASVTKSPAIKSRSHSSSSTANASWLHSQPAHSRHEFNWLNSINMIKLDEAALAEQELYVIQSIIDNGTLPRGMKTDLFHAFDNDYTSNSVLLSGIKEDDTISIASTVKKSTTEWIIAKQFMQHNVIPIILKALLFESKDSSMYALALSILELLCLDYTMILEIQHCQVSPFVPSLDSNGTPNSTTGLMSLTVDTHPQQSSSNQLKKGIEILLATISQDSRKDPSIVTSALRVLSAMCTPPHFRYKGNNVNKAKSLLSEVMNRKHASAIAASASGGLTSNSGTAFSASKKITVSSSKKNPIGFPSGFTVGVIFGRLEQIQKGVRTAIRSYSGITSLVQLIHYKKNQFYIITIRLETIKVLIGIAHDNEIKLILSKMRIPTILENQIKFEHSNDYDGVNNAPVVAKTIEKELLFLYSDSLIKLLTKSSMEGITDENVDASQELLDRKAIVEHSHIEFNEAELMYLIKDHLISKGLTQTVELLEKEMAEKEKPRVLVLSQSSNTTTAGLIEGVALSQASIETVPASQKSQAATLTIPRTPHSGSNNPTLAKSDSRKRNMETVLDDAEPSNQILSQQELAVTAIDNGPFMSAEGAAKRARRSVSPLLISTDSIPPLPESNETIKTQQQTYRVKSPVPRSIRAKNVRRAFKEEFFVKNNAQQEQKERVSLTPTPFHSQVTPSDSTALSRQSSLVPTSPTSKGYDAAKATKPLPLIGHSTPTASSITALTNSQSAQKKTFVHYPAPQPSHSQSHSHSHAHGHSHHGHGHNSQGKANNHVPSKLSNIMHRYLKLQHQQCKHPITTLPILSLQKAHACPKPSISSYSSSHKQPSHNIYSLHSRKFAYSNTSWYNNYYRKHDYQQQLSFIYSNYRTIKSFRELESPSAMTSMVFSKKLNQLYIAFNDYTMEEDPGIALVDILTGETSVSGHNGLQGTIMNLTLSPHDFLMLTAISPGDLDFHHLETVLEHELYLWKDPSDITIFDSPALKKFQCKSEAELASLSSSLYIPHEQQQRMNYFHAEAFDPFHQNRLAALKINDFFHQSHQPGGNNTANGPALTTNQRSLTATSGTSANTNNTNTNNNNNNNASDDHQSSSYIFDIETGQILDVLYNDGNSDTYNLPKITYHAHYPSLYFMDGKLWDLRINQIIHKFDKLSNYGNIAIHPHKAEVIIDHALWDLRNFSLVQMIPSIEHCILQFHPVENILYGYTSILDDEHLLEKIFHLPSYTSPVTSKGGNHHHDGSSNGGNYFHVLHGTEYSHITTEYIEKEYFNIMSLQVDPFHNGYLSTLLFNIHDANDSIVRIYEIGKRRKVVGDDSDDEGEEDDSEAEDEEWRDVSEEDDDDDEEEDDEEDEDEDDSLMDEDEDDEEIEVISENDDAEEGNEEEGDEDDDDESYVEGEDEGEDAEGDDAEEGGGEEEGGDEEEEEEGAMDEEDHIIDLIQSIANRSSFSDQLRSRLNRRRPSLREEDSRPRTNRRSRLRRRNSNQQEASNEEEQEEREEV